MNFSKILILKYKKYLKNKDVSNFIKYFGRDEKLMVEFLSHTKNSMTESEMIHIIDALNYFNRIDKRIINEIETLDESQRPIFINALIKSKNLNVICALSSDVNWITKDNDTNTNMYTNDNNLERLLEVIIESNNGDFIYKFAYNHHLSQNQKSKLVDAIIKTKDLYNMSNFGDYVQGLKSEDLIRLSKAVIEVALSKKEYSKLKDYFEYFKEIKLLKDVVIETKDKIAIIYYIYYAKDFNLLKEVFETPDNYKEFCEKSYRVRLEDFDEFYLEAKFSYVDDNIDKYTAKNGTSKSLK